VTSSYLVTIYEYTDTVSSAVTSQTSVRRFPVRYLDRPSPIQVFLSLPRECDAAGAQWLGLHSVHYNRPLYSEGTLPGSKLGSDKRFSSASPRYRLSTPSLQLATYESVHSLYFSARATVVKVTETEKHPAKCLLPLLNVTSPEWYETAYDLANVFGCTVGTLKYPTTTSLIDNCDISHPIINNTCIWSSVVKHVRSFHLYSSRACFKSVEAAYVPTWDFLRPLRDRA
jgi:hypothetical protein